MKKALLFATLIVAGLAHAQDAIPPGSGGVYNKFPAVSTTGQLGRYITYAQEGSGPPSSHSFIVAVTGTTPSICTYQVETSRDGNPPWVPISGDSSTSTPVSPINSCTASGTLILLNRPFAFIRVNILTYTAGDGTSAVKFSYVRGMQ